MNLLRISALVSASVIALGVSAAQAADLTIESAPVAAAAPATFNWSGFYLGVHAGAAITSFDFSSPLGEGSISEDNTGFLGGVQAGYNWQFDNIVVGLQTDFAYSSAKVSLGDFDGPNGPEQKLEWLGSTTARVGYAFDNLLVYGKGGVAYGQSTFEVPFIEGLSLEDSQWHVGWTAGAGVEYAFTQNITGLLEYNYVDLGSQDYAAGFLRADLTSNVIKAGLNYKF